MADRTEAWARTIVFGGTMLVVTGLMNVIEGFLAIGLNEEVVAFPDRFVLVDLTIWGWTALTFGIVMVAVAVGLFMARTWARIAAILFVGINAVFQVLSLGAYPVWSLLMLALDTIVIFALTARWTDVLQESVPAIDDMQPRSERRMSRYP
jgi:hypothetical protein